MPQATAPKYTWDQIADQLVSGYWRYNDEPERAFHLAADRKITFDFSALAPAEKFLARNAMDAWSAATGIAFVNINKTTGSYWAQIYFDNQDDGAYANSDVDMGVISSSYVNIASDWEDAPKSLNSYWFYTYIHEIISMKSDMLWGLAMQEITMGPWNGGQIRFTKTTVGKPR